jgi:hypothetical protein
VIQKKCWRRENERKDGHAAERNPYTDHALPAHCLEHEEAENAVHEVKKTDHVVRRSEPQGGVEDGRLGGKLGEKKGG